VTTYYGVSAPLGSGKTTAAIGFAAYGAQAGEKIVIAQPSIRLIDQSLQQFRETRPNLAVRSIHGESCQNVARGITEHTTSSSGGEVLFITHTALMQCPHWDRRKEWHLIIDEAPQVFWHMEYALPANYGVLLPALSTEPYNIRYSQLVPGNMGLLEEIAENRGGDQVYGLFQELGRKMVSHKWDMFVLNEQWERFQTGLVTDGKLLVFGLADPMIFNGFADVTMMSANLERTIAYQHFVQHGHTFTPQKNITNKLRFTKHDNGDLLTIHYAVEDGSWSKRKRNGKIDLGDEIWTVNDLIVMGTLDLFDDKDFVWLANKDIENSDPFHGRGIKLPHSPHGLNSFQHIHNAAVLPALNPTPALYNFLDEVAHLNPDEIRQAVYHEAVYQAAGRISTRNLNDRAPKHVVVADRAAAEALADLYPGANVMRLPLADLIPESGKSGRRRIHDSDADRKAAYRKRHKTELLRQLDEVNGILSETKLPYTYKDISSLTDEVNGISSETKLPYTYKDISSLTDAAFGGSLFGDVRRKHPFANLSAIPPSDFIAFMRDLHTRNVAKPDSGLWSPSEFESKPGVSTGRGLANITAVHGVFLDNDGGDLSPEEFAAMLPHYMMVIHNSSSSTPDHMKWRAIIPTTCAMTIDVHREMMLQIRQALNRRGYFDKKQLAKKAETGLGGKCHGFDPSKYNAASMFYLPAQAAAGPHASFFHVFDGGKRKAINPYQWIDKTIINHQPEPEPLPATVKSIPAPPVRKDPKLTRALLLIESEKRKHHRQNYEERVDAAIQRWHEHPKGSGNQAFFDLAMALAGAGMERSEIKDTLYAEAAYAHGQDSQRDRRAAISHIMSKLRCAA
jgi:hypothetical protein